MSELFAEQAGYLERIAGALERIADALEPKTTNRTGLVPLEKPTAADSLQRIADELAPKAKADEHRNFADLLDDIRSTLNASMLE